MLSLSRLAIFSCFGLFGLCHWKFEHDPMMPVQLLPYLIELPAFPITTDAACWVLL